MSAIKYQTELKIELSIKAIRLKQLLIAFANAWGFSLIECKLKENKTGRCFKLIKTTQTK